MAGGVSVGEALANEGDVSKDAIELRYGLEDKPPAGAAILYGAQHVLIMFSAMVASPLVIGQLLNLSPDLRADLITGVMLGCGVGTMISALGAGWIGARLPLLLGAYTVYIAPVVAIAKAESLGAATGAMLIGGIVLLAISPLIGKLRSLFPPLVVGALLVITGMALIKIAMSVAFGLNTPYAGQPMTIVFLLLSIGLILLISMSSRGSIRSLAILIALVVTYVIASFMGFANFAGIANAPWFRMPHLLPYGIAWPSVGGLTTVVIYNLVAAIYTMSITMALCAMIRTQPDERRIRGAIAGDGLGSVIAVLFGGVPLISYDQNVGAISLTGVGSRFVVAISGAMLIAMAFFPKISAVIGMVPPFLLGGTLVFMFGMITVVGIRIISQVLGGQRDMIILAASIGLSAVVDFAPLQVFESITPTLRILSADGIVVGTAVAVLLNKILPAGKAPTAA